MCHSSFYETRVNIARSRPLSITPAARSCTYRRISKKNTFSVDCSPRSLDDAISDMKRGYAIRVISRTHRNHLPVIAPGDRRERNLRPKERSTTKVELEFSHPEAIRGGCSVIARRTTVRELYVPIVGVIYRRGCNFRSGRKRR